MSAAAFLGFVVNAAFSALNAALYVATGSAVSLGAAVFCGAMALFVRAIGVNA